MFHPNRKSAVRRSGLAATALLATLNHGSISPALAQNSEPAASADTLEEVVVSASRIDRAGFTAPTPTVVVGAETLESRATVNVGDVLNEIPAFRSTNTPSGGGIGNTGAQLADLRGLTAQRTLVLLDKMRLPATNLPGTTVVIATHDIALMDQYDCRRLVLHDGRLHAYD